MFLSHSYSFSTSLTFTLFSQDSQRQSPHAGTHYNPLLNHEHNRVPHGLFKDSLYLQRKSCRRFSRVVSKSVFTCSKAASVVFNPDSNAFEQLTSNSFHCTTCKWTRKAWKKIALLVEVDFQALKIRM